MERRFEVQARWPAPATNADGARPATARTSLVDGGSAVDDGTVGRAR